MKTFCIQTLGCKVNQYESDQLAALLRARGLVPADASDADLRIVNTCSVTTEAASKSRQYARRATRSMNRRISLPQLTAGGSSTDVSRAVSLPFDSTRAKVIVTGCWATSDPEAAAALPGVDAVVGHHDDVNATLDRLLDLWQGVENAKGDEGSDHGTATGNPAAPATTVQVESAGRIERSRTGVPSRTNTFTPVAVRGSLWKDGWIDQAGPAAGNHTSISKATPHAIVNENLDGIRSGSNGPLWQAPHTGHPERASATRDLEPRELQRNPEIPPSLKLHRDDARCGVATNNSYTLRSSRPAETRVRTAIGTTRLPLLDQRQEGRQRAVLKIQDGCDAHCTYCIIPSLRPTPWSKPVDDVVHEARALVDAGHVEIVLTGIFLGAYGQPTALRRRQPPGAGLPLARLIDALCTRVPGLRRLRLSSLEPGDLTDDLLAALRSHRQVVPHFHLPLQSGSDVLLRRMNRQYGRDDFLRMLDRVHAAFDRPALTTDVIAGFPGETDAEFARTLEVVDAARFIHVHAFPFSPRPGTAAARWTRDFVRGPIVNERIALLRARGETHGLAFRRQFLGETVELLVEQGDADEKTGASAPALRHGRCERYFDVGFEADDVRVGDFLRVRATRNDEAGAFGTVVERI